MQQQSPLVRDCVIAAVCVIFCLAGAVNSGWSRYFFAIPFAVFLTRIVLRRAGSRRALLLVPLFLTCGFVSHTQDDNPYLYPGRNGVVTLAERVCLVEVKSAVSGNPPFRMLVPSCSGKADEPVLAVLPQGSQHRVLGIAHSYADMGDRVEALVRVNGEVHLLRVDHDLVEPPLQAAWARYLGMLMAWPLLPIVLIQLPSFFK